MFQFCLPHIFQMGWFNHQVGNESYWIQIGPLLQAVKLKTSQRGCFEMTTILCYSYHVSRETWDMQTWLPCDDFFTCLDTSSDPFKS